jgi:hypothetical protein
LNEVVWTEPALAQVRFIRTYIELMTVKEMGLP